MRHCGRSIPAVCLSLFIAATVLMMSGCFDSGARIERSVEEALVSARQGEISNATARLEQLHDQHPEDAGVEEALGLVYEMRNEPLVAASHFVRAASLSPDKRVRLVDAANNLMTAGRKEEAETRLAAYLEQFPEDYKAWLRIGRLQQDINLKDKAADSLVRGILLSGQDTPPVEDFIRVGQLFLEKKDYPRSDFYFNRALGMVENGPVIIPALIGLIESSVLQKDWLIADLFLKRMDSSFPGALETSNKAALRAMIEKRIPHVDVAAVADNAPDKATQAVPSQDPSVKETPTEPVSVAATAEPVPATVDPVLAPALSPGAGVFNAPVQISIATASKDVEIRYSLDGSDVTKTSRLYVEPLMVSDTRLIKARAFAEDGRASEETIAVYDIEIPQAVADQSSEAVDSPDESTSAVNGQAVASGNPEAADENQPATSGNASSVSDPVTSPDAAVVANEVSTLAADQALASADMGSKASLSMAVTNGQHTEASIQESDSTGTDVASDEGDPVPEVAVQLPEQTESPAASLADSDSDVEEAPVSVSDSYAAEEEFVHHQPENAAELLASNGKQAIMEGDYPKAIRFLWDSLSINNGNAHTWFLLSHAYSKHRQHLNAESASLESMRLAPLNSRYALQYLRVAQFSKTPVRFHEELLSVYQRFPREPEIILALARSYARIRNDPANAHALYARFLAIAPDHSMAGEVEAEMRLVE